MTNDCVSIARIRARVQKHVFENPVLNPIVTTQLVVLVYDQSEGSERVDESAFSFNFKVCRAIMDEAGSTTIRGRMRVS